MSDTKFGFRAFISYSSRDRLQGQQFQNALETYKIPRPLRGRLTAMGVVPKRVTPIFRDRSDLEASGDLGARIEKALTASRALIVLCSPHSASSKWVNQEIITFKRLGRADQIIAVLVEGRPVKYEPEGVRDGAFPPALIHMLGPDGELGSQIAPEPFAPDLREMQPDGTGGDGFEFAKLKVVARLIGVSLAELTQRQRETERRERRVIQAIAALMLVLALGATIGGWFAWRKSLEANRRLNETIGTAARQIQEASKYRDRYGVPTKVIQEMLSLARRDFSGLLNDVGRTPELSLQNARLALTFAEAYQSVDETRAEREALELAESDLAKLAGHQPSILERLGLTPQPSEDAIASARLRLFDARTKAASRNADHAQAHKLAHDRLVLAQQRYERTQHRSWRRQVALSHLSLGNVHYLAAAPERSRHAFEQGISEIEGMLSEQDDTALRHDLYDGVTWLAQLLVENAEHRAGLVQQQRASEIARRLTRDEPDNKENKRSLAQVVSLIGDATLNLTGDAAKAHSHYVEAEKLARELAATEPQRVDWQHDLYVVLERRGSTDAQLGRLDGAAQAYEEAAQIVDRLLKRAPDNRGRLRDVSVMQERLAQFYGAQSQMLQSSNDMAAREAAIMALKASRRAVEIRTKLATGSGNEPIPQFDLASAILIEAKVLALQPADMPAAWTALKQAREIIETLTREPDKRLGWFHTLAAVHATRAQFFMKEQSPVAANGALQDALKIIRELRRKEPENERFVHDETDIREQMTALEAKPN